MPRHAKTHVFSPFAKGSSLFDKRGKRSRQGRSRRRSTQGGFFPSPFAIARQELFSSESEAQGFSERLPEGPQVAQVIERMHAEHPSVEVSRETLPTANGVALVRVVKKRRISTTVAFRDSFSGKRPLAAAFVAVAAAVLLTALVSLARGEAPCPPCSAPAASRLSPMPLSPAFRMP